MLTLCPFSWDSGGPRHRCQSRAASYPVGLALKCVSMCAHVCVTNGVQGPSTFFLVDTGLLPISIFPPAMYPNQSSSAQEANLLLNTASFTKRKREETDEVWLMHRSLLRPPLMRTSFLMQPICAIGDGGVLPSEYLALRVANAGVDR